MLQKDRKILKHLTPLTDYADVYLCGVYYKNKDIYIDSVYGKVAEWVKAKGGTIKVVENEVVLVGETKGYLVRIVFPAFNPAKELMSSICNIKINYPRTILKRERYGQMHEHTRYITAKV